ncbi:hypothetical protein ACFQU9_17150 [Actinomadura namibiensis]|uniref:Uncharacterized protein n=1 Tax=Actinomadura namibiensis TaxID=182080 RepID=A0A7W3LRS3_ACTNM|nr:hypothetical protein [Actinomadura namibiensis]MBA8953119.1 hypothetical protein [Actinomadura namibiensis]
MALSGHTSVRSLAEYARASVRALGRAQSWGSAMTEPDHAVVQ